MMGGGITPEMFVGAVIMVGIWASLAGGVGNKSRHGEELRSCLEVGDVVSFGAEDSGESVYSE